jgi:hypothetical protein
MKIRALLTKINDKLRPPHVKGEDVNEAFTRGAEEAPSYFVSSQQDERPH